MSFSSDMQRHRAAYLRRMETILRESIQRTITDAQRPKAKGGRMPVDTGFLRNSGQPSVPPARLGLGQPFFFGWSADYAQVQEARNAFLRGAVEKWAHTVKAVTREAGGR